MLGLEGRDLSCVRRDELPVAPRLVHAAWLSMPLLCVSINTLQDHSACEAPSMPSQTTPLATCIDAALRRCAARGISLRAIARAAELPPGMLSQMRYGRLGVPLPRLMALAEALHLNTEESWEFQRLVRSDQARRSVHRGTSYVAELEAVIAEQRSILHDIEAWLAANRLCLPDSLSQRLASMRDDPAAATAQSPSAPSTYSPWATRPSDDMEDTGVLEALNDRGQPIMAEYRIHVRDSVGHLVHGDIFVVEGIRSVMDALARRYASGQLGRWPSGWYRCDIMRKAVPTAMVRVGWFPRQ